MKAESRLDVALRLLIATMTAGLLTQIGAAQTGDDAAADRSYIAVVTQEKAPVLSGPHDSFYPFGRLEVDSLVRVVEHRDRWARVQTVGPAFGKTFGYVRYHRDEPGRMRLDEAQGTALTMGEIDLLAPNLNAEASPGASWKPLVTMPADVKLAVIEKTETEREVILKVKLPVTATGYVSMASIRRATPAEKDQWQAALAELETTIDPDALTRMVLARDETSAPTILLPGQAAPETAPPAAVETPPTVVPMPELTPGTIVATDPARASAPEGAVDTAAPAEADAPATPLSESLMASGDWEAALEHLEEELVELQAEPIETAEVDPLRELYLELSRRSTKRNVARFAESRAEQLAIWSDLQLRKQELARLRARVDSASFEASSVRRALETSGTYVAVGRLAVSSIYDGRQLPRLLRLQDPTSGRTIAYLQPGDYEDLDGLLGRVVGIVGTKQYDGGLRVNLIAPERVEPLSPKGSL